MPEPIDLEDLGKIVLALFTKHYESVGKTLSLWTTVPQAIDSNILRASKNLCTDSVDTKQPCDNLALHVLSLLTELPQCFLVYSQLYYYFKLL